MDIKLYHTIKSLQKALKHFSEEKTKTGFEIMFNVYMWLKENKKEKVLEKIDFYGNFVETEKVGPKKL